MDRIRDRRCVCAWSLTYFCGKLGNMSHSTERTESVLDDGTVIVTERSAGTTTTTITKECGCETRSSHTKVDHPIFDNYGSSSYTGSTCFRHQPVAYLASV